MTAKLSMICSMQSNGTYFAMCPEIKGCFTQGDTYEQIAGVVVSYLSVLITERR